MYPRAFYLIHTGEQSYRLYNIYSMLCSEYEIWWNNILAMRVLLGHTLCVSDQKKWQRSGWQLAKQEGHSINNCFIKLEINWHEIQINIMDINKSPKVKWLRSCVLFLNKLNTCISIKAHSNFYLTFQLILDFKVSLPMIGIECL